MINKESRNYYAKPVAGQYFLGCNLHLGGKLQEVINRVQADDVNIVNC